MDLGKNGKLLRKLRQERGMTQKALAEKIGVVPKTISKWETGRGFPDVSTLSILADLLGVSERSLLFGDLVKNRGEVGNMKRIKFYVCPHCGSITQGVGESMVTCCGKQLLPLSANSNNDGREMVIKEIEDEFCIEISHEMQKEHYIVFIAYVGFDRVYTYRLYPEQDCLIRLPKVYSGKIIYYCNKHGLFERKITKNN